MIWEAVAEITDPAEAAKFRLSRALLTLLSNPLFLQTMISMKNMGRDTGHPVYSALWLLWYIAANYYLSQSWGHEFLFGKAFKDVLKLL